MTTKAPTASYVHFLRLVEAEDERAETSHFVGYRRVTMERGQVYRSKLLGSLQLTPNGKMILEAYGHKARPIKKPDFLKKPEAE